MGITALYELCPVIPRSPILRQLAADTKDPLLFSVKYKIAQRLLLY